MVRPHPFEWCCFLPARLIGGAGGVAFPSFFGVVVLSHPRSLLDRVALPPPLSDGATFLLLLFLMDAAYFLPLPCVLLLSLPSSFFRSCAAVEKFGLENIDYESKSRSKSL